ncbi:MAG: VWA domain-containing protein [Campylobacterota bacterium]|nr:VWA domain-containing protein [Campylobacterota bacterium]
MQKLLILLFFIQTLLHAQPHSQAMIVLGASGSMWGKIDGRDKFTIVKEALSDSFLHWNDDINLGLISYGHHLNDTCIGSQVLIIPAKPDEALMFTTLQGINPKGEGSISHALMGAAKAMDYPDEQARVVLITDGKDNGKLDPCEMAKSIKKEAMNFKIYVIGLSTDKAQEKRLQCIADVSEGEYYLADTTAAVNSALHQVIEKIQSLSERPKHKNIHLSASEKENSASVGATHTVYKVIDTKVQAKTIAHCHSEHNKACQRHLDKGEYLIKTKYRGLMKETPIHVTSAKNRHIHVTLNETGALEIIATQKKGGKRLKAVHTLYKLRHGKIDKSATATCSSDIHESCLGRIAAGSYLVRSQASGLVSEKMIEVSTSNINLVEMIMGEIGKVEISSRVKSDEVKAFHTIYNRETMQGIATCWSEKERPCEKELPAGRYSITSEYNNQTKKSNLKLRGSESERVRVVFSSN